MQDADSKNMELAITSVQILRPEHFKKRSALEGLPLYLRSLARKIETGNFNFNETELNFLENFYKEVVLNKKKPNFWIKLKSFFIILYLLIKYDFDYVLDLTEAVRQLVNALTDLVEQNNPSYHALIQKVLASTEEPEKELTVEEMNAIFQEVENKVH